MIRNEKKKNQFLSGDPATAVRSLISLSKKLCGFAEQEMHALTVGDMLRFAYIQQDKEKIAVEYTMASEEFRSLIEEFKKVDKVLIRELEKLQLDLKKKSSENNFVIKQMRDRSISNTKGTLFTAQEIGQRVTWPQKQPLPYAQQGA